MWNDAGGVFGLLFFGGGGKEMQSVGLRGPQPRPAEARNSFYVRLRPPQAAAHTTRRSRIVTMFYAVRRRRQECDSSPPRGAAANCAALKNRNIHMRQPHPRQKRFRIKGGRGDGALRIGDFLILKNAKHPIQRRRKDGPEIVSPRRFLGYLLSAQKVTYEKKYVMPPSLRARIGISNERFFGRDSIHFSFWKKKNVE